jgi:DNA-binding response OmpR family regulator
MPLRDVRVLVIEDEPDLREAAMSYLRFDGCQAWGASSLRSADAWMKSNEFDVLVLDLGLPDGDGLAWLEARNDLASKGVVIASARGASASRIGGLRAGADAFLVKPVPLEELSATIASVMRRMRPTRTTAWRFHHISWHIESPEGLRLKLTHAEYQLLYRLAQEPGVAVERNELVRLLGHDPRIYDPRRMEILIRRLRTKALETLGYSLPLETVYRCGYAFTAPVHLA